MGKKTNKTEHVLNLLMGQTEEAKSNAELSSREQPVQETKPAAESATLSRTDTPAPKVMFVDSPQSDDHPMSNAIKDSLEREAAQMGLIPQERQAKKPPSPEKIPAKESAVHSENNSTVPEDLPYRYINVMEEGVKELCIEYMTKLGVCTCDRCQNDVTALSLTHLSPKYIVADTSAVSPLLNFYRNKYSSQIMAELTKACFAVISQPRH